MRQQGAQQPVCSMGDGSVYVCICECAEGGAIFKGCWEGNWCVFLGLHLQ